MDLFNRKKLAELQQQNQALEEKNQELINELDRYTPITSIEKEVEMKQAVLDDLLSQIEELRVKYSRGQENYERLEQEINLFHNDLESISFGIYEPVFDYEDSETFKDAIREAKEDQKYMIHNESAVRCGTEWVVEGSKSKGQQMMKRQTKLMLRAFNGECDALIAKVNWNNVVRIKERIWKASEAINKLGASNDMTIVKEYVIMKEKELQLTYEYRKKKHEEKEEEKEIRAEQREEERAQKELERARKKALDEEAKFQKALDKAEKELGYVSGDEHEKLNAQIEALRQKLQEATENKERAISRAQETRSGHVYIISNLGSFGENVYKIGMTRRLEPMDRVKELGDASVPFQFDVHAMMFSKDAPGLEASLHQAFKDRRVNKVNMRKEYFQASLDEIEKVVSTVVEDDAVEFIKVPEAQEFRETRMLIRQMEEEKDEPVIHKKFSDDPFA
ncbi:MAG: DUF4041 domain-containing protein [bacterium]|nr:DUF4041 domain-containing protein [bacterium]